MIEFKDDSVAGSQNDVSGCSDNKILEKKENITKKTSKYETLLHLIKANIGVGILALPHAISNVGLLVGTVGLIMLATVCIYCMHLVVNCSQMLAAKMSQVENEKSAQKQEKETNGKHNQYIITENVTKKIIQNIKEGESIILNEDKFAVNTMLVLTQFGFCCVYYLFIAESFHKVFANLHILPSLRTSDIMLIQLPFMILLNLFPRLSSLTIVTTTAIVLQTAGLAMVFFYFLTGERSNTVIPYMAPVWRWPLYFGTAMFAFESIGVVLPLENEMQKKDLFRGWTGVLNLGMCIVAVIFTSVGVCGYIKYGADVETSITFNLPSGWFSELIRLMFALAILLTYPLQMYVPFSFTLPYLKKKFIRDSYKKWIKQAIECGIRASFVTFTFVIASSVPMLDLIISFVGAFASSSLSLILPPVIQVLTIWESDIRHKKLMITIDFFICLFGLFGLFLGSGTALSEMWKIYSFTNTSSSQNFTVSTFSGFS